MSKGREVFPVPGQNQSGPATGCTRTSGNVLAAAMNGNCFL